MTKPIDMVTITGACKLLGKSRPTVMEYINRGMPVVRQGGKGQSWQLNPDAILRWKMAIDGADAESGGANGVRGSYEAGRARKINAEAAIKEIALERARGESVSVELVEMRWAAIFSNVKTRMLAITPRVAPLIPALGGSIVEIEALLDNEIRGVLMALAESAHIPHDEIEQLDSDDDASRI